MEQPNHSVKRHNVSLGREDLLADAGYLQSEGYQTGRVLADTPGGRTVVYNNGDWHQRGRWQGGDIRKIQKQDAKNAPRVQKNVDILQQNVAAAIVNAILIKIGQPLLEPLTPLTINLFVIKINKYYI